MSPRTTYRLAPRDRTGWVLGLSGPQVVILGTAVMVGVLASSRVGLVIAGIPVALAAAVAFGRLRGRPLLEVAPPALAWARRRLRHRTTWAAPSSPPAMPVAAGDDGSEIELALPPPMDGQLLLSVDAVAYDPALDGASIAVVRDPRTETYTAALSVASSSFTLTEPAEQDRLLAAWGDALAGFCTEAGPVTAVRWLEWAAPAGLDEQLAYLAEHGHGDTADPAYASYRLLLGRAGPLATRHHCLLTVTVDARRVTARQRHRGDARAACVEALLGELRLFAGRLERAGLVVGQPLSPPELSATVAARLDPEAAPVTGGRRSLAQRAGLAPAGPAGAVWPSTTDARRGHWAVGSSVHRCFWVAEWPRLEVGADWMQPLVLAAGAVRTLALVAEPVAPRRSHRAIERDATKLASDEEHRRAKGFRVSASHRRAQADVEERESQLVAGFGEFTYAGIVTVAAADVEALERACDDLCQVAAGAGVWLTPLDFRHDQAVAACLPLARALAPSGRGL
jgi:hypothetical protein